MSCQQKAGERVNLLSLFAHKLVHSRHEHDRPSLPELDTCDLSALVMAFSEKVLFWSSKAAYLKYE